MAFLSEAAVEQALMATTWLQELRVVTITDASRLVTITSVGDSTRKDAVKVKVNFSTCGC